MKSFRLNRALVLESPTEVADGAGGAMTSWDVLGTLWADVKLRNGRERRDAGQALSSVGYKITVRAAPTSSVQRPRPDQRFRDGTRIFDIRAVAETDADGRYLTCFCVEETAA